MSIPLAYTAVVIIWSTTPLTIQWSSMEVGFQFGVAARMVIGLWLALALLPLFGWHLRRDAIALKTYALVGLSVFSVMSCVYWSAQYVASGLISVVFGLVPIISGLLARWWLGAAPLTPVQWLGLISALGGLAVIFGGGLALDAQVAWGLGGLLLATLFHAGSAVALKKVNGDVPGLMQTSGGLLIATPLFLLSWWLGGGEWPESIPTRAAWSIVYLGVFGSVIGFAFYFHVLRHVDAVRVGLITLMTPVLALVLGNQFNHEPLTLEVLSGTGLILLGLVLFQWSGRLLGGRVGERVPVGN
jgi:drug/metabolite transporter (DMT)-like permease